MLHQELKQFGEQFALVSGYTLAEVPYNSSFAGYKDWFIQTYNRPAYTIEAGLGEIKNVEISYERRSYT